MGNNHRLKTRIPWDAIIRQWNRALDVSPPFVFITGWNEWVMMRFNKQNSPFYGSGEVTFVDQFNAEYSRDIEPADCPHQDNYYYQTIANIRRYKGVRQLPEVASKPILLDGDFSDWATVSPEFRDDIGDRFAQPSGWGSEGIYQTEPAVTTLYAKASLLRIIFL